MKVKGYMCPQMKKPVSMLHYATDAVALNLGKIFVS
jgi:hypothetical protein